MKDPQEEEPCITYQEFMVMISLLFAQITAIYCSHVVMYYMLEKFLGVLLNSHAVKTNPDLNMGSSEAKQNFLLETVAIILMTH